MSVFNNGDLGVGLPPPYGSGTVAQGGEARFDDSAASAAAAGDGDGEAAAAAARAADVTAPTELSRWRLEVFDGGQKWWYDDAPTPARPQSMVEKHHVGLDTSGEAPALPRARSARQAAENGVRFYARLQTEDGHWAGDYGGPMFLLPGLVIVCYITGTRLGLARAREMVRYLHAVERQGGGWGLHVEKPADMFATCLNYVTLRLLGVDRDAPLCVRARAFIHEHGGACAIPSWGKFWLAVLNVYDWEGVHAIVPELWVLPKWSPVHMGRLWCHVRQVYLPMSYCFGAKFQAAETPLIMALREELYTEPYDRIDWPRQRSCVAQCDLYHPHTYTLEALFYVLGAYEPWHSARLRAYALDVCYDHVRRDDENTDYISIGPISKVINMLVRWQREGRGSDSYRHHVRRLADYLWLGRDGMKMQGTNGSQLWDCAFAVQALIESGAGRLDWARPTLERAFAFLDLSQIKENTRDTGFPGGIGEAFYRHINKGGFPFSTRDCGWIVADCTAEGLKAAMYLAELPVAAAKALTNERVYDGVNLLLSLQSANGGYATYETMRDGAWLECINAAEVFRDIMVDYTYVECTSAAMQCLAHVRQRYPEHRRPEIDACIRRGMAYIRSIQRPDGSWEGSWGVCMTYGTWFGLEALVLDGERYDRGTASEAMVRACEYLLSKQAEDGGWGESWESCVERCYVPSASQVTMTSWALLGLLAARYPNRKPLEKAAQLLRARQLDNGDWPQEAIAGVFNKTAMIHYDAYRNVFPIWALGRYARVCETPPAVAAGDA